MLDSRDLEAIGALILQSESRTRESICALEMRVANTEKSLSNLENQMASFENRMTGLENRMTDLENRMTGFENRMTDFENRMTGFENQMAGFENRMTGFENQMAGLENRMTGFENQMAGLENRMTGFENQMAGFKDEIADVQNQLTDLKKHTENSFSSLEARMTTKIQDAIFKSESLLLDEMERYDRKNESRFANIQRETENLKITCRLSNLEQGTIEILNRTMIGFEKRLTALEAGAK